MRRYLAWPLAVPLAVIGTLSGHALGYWVAVPDAHARAELLAASGHGYLAYAPLVVGLSSAVVGLAFLAAVVSAYCGRERAHGVQVRLVAAVAPLAFVVQELLERLLHEGHVHPHLFISAPFLFGLLAQIPFALLGAALAYALGRAAACLGTALAARQLRSARPLLAHAYGCSVDLPLRPALARGYAGRGPPLACS